LQFFLNVIFGILCVVMSSNPFRRKILALGYKKVDKFSSQDTSDFQDLVFWLEDQKICFYKPEDRVKLKAGSADWSTHFKSYINDMKCPYADSSNDTIFGLVTCHCCS